MLPISWTHAETCVIETYLLRRSLLPRYHYAVQCCADCGWVFPSIFSMTVQFGVGKTPKLVPSPSDYCTRSRTRYDHQRRSATTRVRHAATATISNGCLAQMPVSSLIRKAFCLQEYMKSLGRIAVRKSAEQGTAGAGPTPKH